MNSIYHWIRGLFKRKRRISLEEIETALPADVLARLQAEAEFLREHHGVEVCELAADEEPGLPRAADGADIAQPSARRS